MLKSALQVFLELNIQQKLGAPKKNIGFEKDPKKKQFPVINIDLLLFLETYASAPNIYSCFRNGYRRNQFQPGLSEGK